MRKLERLADMAGSRSVPRPLDSAGVMARIRGLEREDDRVLSMPLGFFLGGAVAAAVAAFAVSWFAVSAWQDMGHPLTAMESMFDVMDVL